MHPPRQADFDRQIQDLNRQQREIRNSRPPGELTIADRDQIRELEDEQDELADASRLASEPWGRNTSIILIVLATLAMGVSLVRADRLPVISNGLLLGGVFTMVYGVGWIVATDTSVARFVVMTAALAITLALGYVRFARRHAISVSPSGRGIGDDEGLPDIEQRVRQLEERMNDAANALGHKSDRSQLP